MLENRTFENFATSAKEEGTREGVQKIMEKVRYLS